MSRSLALATTLLLAACATLEGLDETRRYGVPDPTRFVQPKVAVAAAPEFQRDVQPILRSRCVVCHACYDAPCQLQLGSWDGVARGASPERVYQGTRLRAADPTRLHVDALEPSVWRSLGFHPVLNERDAQFRLHGSLLYRVLDQKRRQPLPDRAVLGEPFDFSLDRPQQCNAIGRFEDFESDQPLAGMPYGLPPLNDLQFETISRWLDAGSPVEPPAPLPAATQEQVAAWEAFFNGAGGRMQLTARYLYEHLFLGALHFGDGKHWFRLIRSRTPPGLPILPVATRRPFDNPAGQFFYRLQRNIDVRVAKTHLPYRLDAARMARWQSLFLDGLPPVDALPIYSGENGANPFRTYRDIPVASRYQFLLDDAAYFVDGFIKGPVCRGQVALNVIRDRFWVFFARPETHSADVDAFLASETDKLALPVDSVNQPVLISWLRYHKLEQDYQQARAKFLEGKLGEHLPVTLDLVWDGNGRNANAALTVFRHFDSASVVQGLVGDTPTSGWIITYPILERIHYLLVAGFDVFGNIGHQLNARLYMDFLRMEAENNFLTLLPRASRLPALESWYHDDADQVLEKFRTDFDRYGVETSVIYQTADPLRELFVRLRDHVQPILGDDLAMERIPDQSLVSELDRLRQVHGLPAALLPELSFLRVVDGDRHVDLTLLRDSAHRSVSQLFAERRERIPARDRLTILRGSVGAYPNAFFRVPRPELAAFIDAAQSLDSPTAYERMADRWGVRRTAMDFWQHLDALHDDAERTSPLAFGLFDLNRLEDR